MKRVNPRKLVWHISCHLQPEYNPMHILQCNCVETHSLTILKHSTTYMTYNSFVRVTYFNSVSWWVIKILLAKSFCVI